MERGDRLLIDGLNGDGEDLFVSGGLEDGLGIGLVGLVSFSVGTDKVCRQKRDLVSK